MSPVRRWKASKPFVSRRGAVRRRRPLLLEELETRALPSAGLTGVAEPAVTFPFPTGGYTPYQIRHAYGFDAIKLVNGKTTVPGTGAGQTIAIIDAYNDPQIVNDLAVFDSAYGLPAPPKFTRVGQTGGALPTQQNDGWADETSLDVEWAHALAPAASILLVETNTNAFTDLFTGVKFADKQAGVSVVSMSFGGPEFTGENTFDSTFITPAGHGGVTFVVSSGDDGAPGEYPAYSPNVLAVGGTSLNLNAAGAYASETGWGSGAANQEGSGGGQSVMELEPSYQLGVQHSTRRQNPDVSFDANPNTGVPIYDTHGISGQTGWFQFGGTSFAAPSWAALLAIANQGRALAHKASLLNQQAMGTLYALPEADFHDITVGNNGFPAKVGYDLVTGRGSPKANLVVAGLVSAVSLAHVGGTDPGSTIVHILGHANPGAFAGVPQSGNFIVSLGAATAPGQQLTPLARPVALQMSPTSVAATTPRLGEVTAQADQSSASLNQSVVQIGLGAETDFGLMGAVGSGESAIIAMEGATDLPVSQSTVTNVVDRGACDALFEGAAATPLPSDSGAYLEQGVETANPTALAALGVLWSGHWFEQYSEPKTRRYSPWRKRL
jgi:hypothetical protein